MFFIVLYISCAHNILQVFIYTYDLACMYHVHSDFGWQNNQFLLHLYICALKLPFIIYIPNTRSVR